MKKRIKGKEPSIWEKMLWNILIAAITAWAIFISGITLLMIFLLFFAVVMQTSLLIIKRYPWEDFIRLSDIEKMVEKSDDKTLLSVLNDPDFLQHQGGMFVDIMESMLKHDRMDAMVGLSHSVKRYVIENTEFRFDGGYVGGIRGLRQVLYSTTKPKHLLTLLSFPMSFQEKKAILEGQFHHLIMRLTWGYIECMEDFSKMLALLLEHSEALDALDLSQGIQRLLSSKNLDWSLRQKILQQCVECDAIHADLEKVIQTYVDQDETLKQEITEYTGTFETPCKLFWLSEQNVQFPEDLLSRVSDIVCQYPNDAWRLMKSKALESSPVLFLTTVVPNYKPLSRLREIWIKTCSRLHIQPKLPREVWVNIFSHLAGMENIPHAEVAAWVATQPKMATLQDTARVMGIPVPEEERSLHKIL